MSKIAADRAGADAVIEGLLPFLAPGFWRETFRRITEMSDGQLRFVGLTSMLAGCCCFSVRCRAHRRKRFAVYSMLSNALTNHA